MKSRWFFCLLASVVVMLAGDRAVAQGSTLLVDNFTKDCRLNTNLWTTNSAFLDALAAASSSPPASFVSPELSFGRRSGMRMAGPTEDYQTTGVQSLRTFKPPFTLTAYVTGTEATADFFEIFLANSDLTQFVTVTADVNPVYDGMWADSPNYGIWQLGTQFSPPIPPALNTIYQVTIKVDAQGSALAIVENLAGTVLSTVTNLQPGGAGPFYVVLGQRIGDAPPGAQVADWSYIAVTTP